MAARCVAGPGPGAVGRAAQRAYSDRDRVERQDDDSSTAGRLRASARLARRLQLHRRSVRRRRTDRARRLLRPRRHAHCLARSGVQAAILETARGGILRRGLAVQRARVAVVTNVTADHFGEYGIDDLAGLADTKLGREHDRRQGLAGLECRRRDAALTRRSVRVSDRLVLAQLRRPGAALRIA